MLKEKYSLLTIDYEPDYGCWTATLCGHRNSRHPPALPHKLCTEIASNFQKDCCSNFRVIEGHQLWKPELWEKNALKFVSKPSPENMLLSSLLSMTGLAFFDLFSAPCSARLIGPIHSRLVHYWFSYFTWQRLPHTISCSLNDPGGCLLRSSYISLMAVKTSLKRALYVQLQLFAIRITGLKSVMYET